MKPEFVERRENLRLMNYESSLSCSAKLLFYCCADKSQVCALRPSAGAKQIALEYVKAWTAVATLLTEGVKGHNAK